jgi:hypothetical protein
MPSATSIAASAPRRAAFAIVPAASRFSHRQCTERHGAAAPPPDNRSDKGPGDDKTPPADTTKNQRARNPDQQGQQANIKQNTNNPGYQQDR